MTLGSNNSNQQKDCINNENNSSNSDVTSSSAQSMETTNNWSDIKSETISRSGDLCQCDCNLRCVSNQNSGELKELRQYIGNKLSELIDLLSIISFLHSRIKWSHFWAYI